MLEALKFVQGAVASKGFAPELTHFRIENGVIKGFNGALALASPIDLNLDVTPKAIPFIKAIMACKETTAMSLTKAGRLSIKSGKFKAFIDCIDETYPEVLPEGDKIEIKTDFIDALKTVAPYMAEDASRPWARGVLLDGQTITATNNIVIAQCWIANAFPLRINLPAKAVKELIRIKAVPTHVSCTDKTVTFYFEDGRWLRSNLVDMDWPNINKVLDRESEQKPIPAGFFEAIEDVKPFVDEVGRIIFTSEGIRTSFADNEGASVDIEGLASETSFNVGHLASIEKIVHTIDFSMYPAPCIFYGANLRGAIVGMQLL